MYLYDKVQSSDDIGEFSSLVASILNALQILLLNFIFNKIAVEINNFENHRTEKEYENALIVKVFTFEFINSYASLFYIAFVAA